MDENYNSNVYVSAHTEGMKVGKGYINSEGTICKEKYLGRRGKDDLSFINMLENPERVEKIRKLNDRKSARKSIRNLLK